jgi:hypothetical protein
MVFFAARRPPGIQINWVCYFQLNCALTCPPPPIRSEDPNQEPTKATKHIYCIAIEYAASDPALPTLEATKNHFIAAPHLKRHASIAECWWRPCNAFRHGVKHLSHPGLQLIQWLPTQ